ncbi:MAG: bifunctional (p)ppGpp synthetase/guanosine-3',5'-bis(diphosphate) 3'-pyrophosphohydrolase, partial [Clostridia bacterium]|nr:bifunctional (p)ppGpp synthetase/guanosine-3',5'-bis(diphosphate) 3'-pyrophosphohydrolase [Clostridia bacterium]
MPIKDLIKQVKEYNPDADVDLIEDAYEFAKEAHKGQQRRSGQEYIVHPIEATKILADLHMDVITIVAGLLHDVVEDTDV